MSSVPSAQEEATTDSEDIAQSILKIQNTTVFTSLSERATVSYPSFVIFGTVIVIIF